MIKTLVIAALAGGMFSLAAPLPAMAKDSMMMKYPAHCLVFPLLQAECRDVIKNNTGVVVGTAATMSEPAMHPHWSCMRRDDGKALLSCSKS